MLQRALLWPPVLLGVVLCAVIAITLRPYHGNPSAFFHLDKQMSILRGVPHGFVVLDEPGYDGEQYYEIARSMPLIFQPSRWSELARPTTIAYSYQRFLLPLLSYALSLGKETWLPYTFLFINIASLIGACMVCLRRMPGKPLYPLALALSPPAMIGLHFSLAEPLTLFLITAFLVRFDTNEKLKTLDIVLLSLLAITREINIFFVGLLLLYLLYRRRFADAFLMIVPVATFVALHTLIYVIFHQIPFLWSTDKHALPFTAILPILFNAHGYTIYTLSSIALFLGFVVPALVWTLASMWNGRHRTQSFLPIAALVFLFIMTAMPGHIWGSITSIGRVITPVYPLVLLALSNHDTLPARGIAFVILLLGIAAGFGLALIPHPFMLS